MGWFAGAIPADCIAFCTRLLASYSPNANILNEPLRKSMGIECHRALLVVARVFRNEHPIPKVKP